MRNLLMTSFILLTSGFLSAGDSFVEKTKNCYRRIPITIDATLGFDYFRSIPDGSWEGNMGTFGALNIGIPYCYSSYCFGLQGGASYGLYNWYGRGSVVVGNTSAVQQQVFISLGLYEQTLNSNGFNAGVVYDWMFNRKASVFAVNPSIAQVRAALGYFFLSHHELGFWGTLRTQTSTEISNQIPIKFRSVNQVNLFWSYYFENSGKTTIWVGTPYGRGLMYSSGRAGEYLFGANAEAPLTKRLSITGHASYMGPRNGSTFQTIKNYAANVCIGLTYAFGSKDSCIKSPYLPLANNTNFLVDTNQNL